MHDKSHLISKRGAQDLSRPAVFIKDSKLKTTQEEHNNRLSEKKTTHNKVNE